MKPREEILQQAKGKHKEISSAAKLALRLDVLSH
jgi:hypothetical protein